MRSPLQIADGHFDHALLTTYSFSLRFFEEWVLRALWAAEIRNIVVFVDRNELGRALEDRAPAYAGRAYHLVADTIARATFHPKLLLLSGSQGSRLCVSSANLTADGQLRNAEGAIAFNSEVPGHGGLLLEAANFFQRLALQAPEHAAAAVQAALSAMPSDFAEVASTKFRLRHNLDQSLMDAVPLGQSIRAITPFADAKGEAAAALHERGDLTVVVDGDQISAASEFFEGAWTVDARRFESRLHAKIYEVETSNSHSTVIGSPNLSEAGLQRTASAGNLEVAVSVEDSKPLALPDNEKWDVEDVAALAEARLNKKRRESEEARISAIAVNAREDGNLIVVESVPDGSIADRWWNERWVRVGIVSNGAILLPDPDVRPGRLRITKPNGGIAYAIVSQPDLLKARSRIRDAGRQTEAVERLPLDVEMLKVLERMLGDLYELSEAADKRRSSSPSLGDASGNQPPDLNKWMPRTEGDAPQIPALYRDNWKGEQDALRALIEKVLRIDSDRQPSQQVVTDLEREMVDLRDLEKFVGDDQFDDSEDGESEKPATQRPELISYRRAFLKMFDRGRQFIATSGDATLASAACTYLLHLVEELGVQSVKVDGADEPLVPRSSLRPVVLGLLEAYLERSEADPLCLATARVHLALLIRELQRFNPRGRERVEHLAFRWSADLLKISGDLPSPSQERVGFDPELVNIWLGGYAQRSAWTGIEEEASVFLDFVCVERLPFPTIVGTMAVEKRQESPAFRLLAFAAPTGFDSGHPFAVVLKNTSRSSMLEMHILVCDPVRHVVIEGWRQTHSRRWMERHYPSLSARAVEEMGTHYMMPTSSSTKEWEDLAEASPPLSELASLVGEARALID